MNELSATPTPPLPPRLTRDRTLAILTTALGSLANQHGYTCLLINGDLELLHVVSDASQLLHSLEGNMTQLLDLLPEDLKVPLQTALHRAKQTHQPIVETGLHLRQGEVSRSVSLEVTYHPADTQRDEFFMVMMQTSDRALALEHPEQSEELTDSTYDQPPINQQVFVPNQPLQTLNEDLSLVDLEYQSEIQALIDLSNDINNLLRSSEIGVIFLDRELRVREFTPTATVAAHLVTNDSDCPIQQMAHHFNCPNLLDHLQQVLTTGTLIQEEVYLHSVDQTYLMRIYPYLRDQQQIDGLVMTFVNIDALKQAQQTLQNRTVQLEASEARLAGILELASDAIISINLKQEIILFNKGAESIFGYAATEVLGQPLSILMPDRYTHAHECHVNQYAQSKDGTRLMAQRGIVCARRKDGSEFPVEASISKLDLNGEVTFTTFLRDISEREAARAALSHLAAIILSSGDAIISKSLDGIVTSWNRGAEVILGYTAEDMVGYPITQIIPEDKRAEDVTIMAQVRQGKSVQLETQRRRKDGSLVDLSITISPIRDQDGTVIGASKIARDISDRVAMEVARQQAEAALQDSESTKQAIIQAIPDLLIQMKVDGTYLAFISDTDFNVMPIDQFHPKMHIFDILPPDIAATQLHYARMAIASGRVQVLDQSLMVDGKLCYEEVRIVPLRADEVLVMIRDMSDRKQAELQLRSSQQQLQLALEASEEGLWDWNISTGELYLSPHWLEMLGYQVGELPEQVDSWQYLIHPDDAPWVMQRLEAHLADASVGYNFEYRVRTKQGDWLWVANYGKVVDYDTTGKPCRMIGMHRDISGQKQKEAALQAAREAAEAANQAKSMFLANMSHELRTPLNVILGFAQVMRSDPDLTTSQRKDLDTIRRSGDHLLNLINDVLDLSKIEAGKLIIDTNPFDLWSLLHTLSSMMAERAQSKGIVLEVEIAPNVPQFVRADEQKLRQVLLNLLSNAVKFTHQGGVILRVNRLADGGLDPSSTTLQFVVIDTGVGIDAAEQDVIFDPFVQADAGRQTVSGTGLGLTISRKLLELMHGSISIHSVVNQGSTFTVVVPVQISDRPVTSPTQLTAKPIGLAPGQPPRRILVVDDQLENRVLVARILSDLGLEIRQVSTGQEAVYCWQLWQPDLILMDLRMPGMDGYTTTRQIRALEATPSQKLPTVIIALTAQVTHGDRDRALSAGCNDYISKPFTTETLLLKLQEHLGLEYVYADPSELSADPPHTPPAMVVDTNLLSQLPPRWLHNLEDAALCLDDRLISRLVAELPAEFAPLSCYITNLVEQFEFEKLIAWLHELEQ